MAEIFGAVAAGIGLTSVLVKLGRSLRKLAVKIRYARRELSSLADEMKLFTNTCADFYGACHSDTSGGDIIASSLKHLIAWTKSTKRGFKNLLKRVGLLVDGSKNSLFRTMAAQWKWYSSDKEVKLLRASLSVARQSVSALSNLRLVGIIDAEISLLKEALSQGSRHLLEKKLGTTIEQQLEILTQRRSVSKASQMLWTCLIRLGDIVDINDTKLKTI